MLDRVHHGGIGSKGEGWHDEANANVLFSFLCEEREFMKDFFYFLLSLSLRRHWRTVEQIRSISICIICVLWERTEQKGRRCVYSRHFCRRSLARCFTFLVGAVTLFIRWLPSHRDETLASTMAGMVWRKVWYHTFRPTTTTNNNMVMQPTKNAREVEFCCRHIRD